MTDDIPRRNESQPTATGLASRARDLLARGLSYADIAACLRLSVEATRWLLEEPRVTSRHHHLPHDSIALRAGVVEAARELDRT